MTDWTNASSPPNDSRTVRVLMRNGKQFDAWYAKNLGKWLCGGGMQVYPPPAGWREIERKGEA